MDDAQLLDRVRELKLPVGKYALFGSAPMCVRGLKGWDHDVDMIVTQDLYDEYLAKGWEERELPNGSRYLWNDNLEFYKDWKPGVWVVEDLIKEAEVIDGIPYVQLETVLAWKKISAREKDLKHAEMIERFLGSKAH